MSRLSGAYDRRIQNLAERTNLNTAALFVCLWGLVVVGFGFTRSNNALSDFFIGKLPYCRGPPSPLFHQLSNYESRGINVELNLREIGKRIQNERIRMGYTQSQFAEKLYISVSYLARMEGGFRAPSLQTLTSIILLTEASADYLLYGESHRRSIKRELQEVIVQLRSIEHRI